MKELSKTSKVYGTCLKIPSIASEYIEYIPHNLVEPFNELLFPKELDAIIHLAAVTPHALPSSKQTLYKINTVSTLELLEYGKHLGINSFVYASSGGVYGYSQNNHSENDPVSPIDFYALTKYESELLVKHFSQYFSTIILRFFFPYGPKQKNRLIPQLIDKIREDKAITMYNKGDPTINPIYISDVVEAMKRALSLKSSNIINIAGSEKINILELSHLIGSLINNSPRFEYYEDEKIKGLVGDISKMRKLLSFQPRIPLKEGLKKTIYYEDHVQEHLS